MIFFSTLLRSDHILFNEQGKWAQSWIYTHELKKKYFQILESIYLRFVMINNLWEQLTIFEKIHKSTASENCYNCHCPCIQALAVGVPYGGLVFLALNNPILINTFMINTICLFLSMLYTIRLFRNHSFKFY